MLLFVGLGNPGANYAATRHNFGFMAIKAIADYQGATRWDRDFRGVIAETKIGFEKILLLLPETYMNESGRAVQEAVHFYRLPLSKIFVFHDDVAIPFCAVRVKVGGSDAGHNGLRSISNYVGHNYARVRMGVGHPGSRELVESFVLQKFSKEERIWAKLLCDTISNLAVLLVDSEYQVFEEKVNLTMYAAGFRPES